MHTLGVNRKNAYSHAGGDGGVYLALFYHSRAQTVIFVIRVISDHTNRTFQVEKNYPQSVLGDGSAGDGGWSAPMVSNLIDATRPEV